MNYIYGFQNIITGKWYIGQTTQPPEKRRNQHIRSANNPKDKDYNSLFHQKIRQYNINNFSFQVLEKVKNKEELDCREKYWINYYKSFVQDGNGYNLTKGGQTRKNNENYIDLRAAFQTQEEINKIIKEIADLNNTLTDIANKYNVSLSLICEINIGKKYYQDDCNYPIRPLKMKIDEKMVDFIIDLLKQNLSNSQIANLLGVDSDIIYRINYGKAHKRFDEIYPIRRELSERETRANRIKKLLQENKLNNKQIATLVKCDPSVVSNINYGKAYFDSNLTYPIRKKVKPVSTIPKEGKQDCY